MADPDSRTGTTYQTPAIEAYLRSLYAVETEGMHDALHSARAAGLPEIQVSPTDGKILEILLRMIGARKVVELGTLAGYSAQWIVRALPPNGHVWTIERDSKHADVARGVLERSGLADRVTILNGSADELLGTLGREGPFDAVFIDADKGGYERYARWAMANLRPGGLVLGDNVFLFGDLAGREGEVRSGAESIRAMRAFHELLARECDSVVLPTPDGLSVAIKR